MMRRQLAENLGIRFELLCITDIFERLSKDPARCFRRAERRCHRREPAIARTRQAVDGAFQ